MADLAGDVEDYSRRRQLGAKRDKVAYVAIDQRHGIKNAGKIS
jgi:hypothetical protein